MTKYLVHYRVTDGEWQYDDFDIVTDALSYTDRALIARFYSYSLDEVEAWESDKDYRIRDYQSVRVDDIKPITDDEIKTLNKFNIAYQKGYIMTKQYLKIKISDVKRYIKYYENWYDTFDKDGYKYVVENLMEDLGLSLYANDVYYNDILTSLHNYVKGGEFYPIEII